MKKLALLHFFLQGISGETHIQVLKDILVITFRETSEDILKKISGEIREKNSGQIFKFWGNEHEEKPEGIMEKCLLK